jgi:hypothetical protein
MQDKLNIYECEELKLQIEARAEMNDGELSDADALAIVEIHTQSIEQLGKLVGYMKYLEGFDLLAKTEIDRIRARQKSAASRLESIKRWLLPYIEQFGPKTIGTHRLSTRKSTGVLLAEGFDNPQYCAIETLIKPDKAKIKESIQNGIEVKGAVLEERIHLQIR